MNPQSVSQPPSGWPIDRRYTSSDHPYPHTSFEDLATACVGSGPWDPNGKSILGFSNCSVDYNESSARLPSFCDTGLSHMTMGVKNHVLGDESGGASFANSCFSQDGVFIITFDRHSPGNRISYSQIYPPLSISPCPPVHASFRARPTLGLKRSSRTRTRPG